MNVTMFTAPFTARSRAALISAAVVAAGVLSAGVSSAGADPSKPVVADPAPFSYASPADRERMERQAPLIAAADLIEKAAEQDRQKDHGSGYTSIELGADSVIVHWKGAVPGAVRAAADAAGRDVPVEVKAAKHSKTELDAAEKRIQEELTRRPGLDFSMEIPADGSGVVLNTEGTVEDAKRKVPYVGLPVRVQQKKNPKPAFSRLADTAPFWGGARITRPATGALCTSGFGVSNSYGSKFILTAGHCGPVGSAWSNGNQSLNIGNAYSRHTAYDVMLIPANAGGRIYDGGVGTNEFSKDVVGAANVHMGEWLCASGSVSGAVCGFEINSFSVSYCSGMTGVWVCYSDLVSAPQKNGMVGVRSGDSGGPVFNLSGPNVIAKGIIQGAGNGGRTLVFQDWGTIVAVWPGLTAL